MTKFQVAHMSHNGRSNVYNWKGFKTPFADPVKLLANMVLFLRAILHQ